MEKPYTILGLKKLLNLMLKYQEINQAYKNIMKEKYGENPNIPKEFSNLGFTKVPTLDEYVTKIMKSSLK